MKKETLSMITMGCLFAVAQLLALLLAVPSKSLGLQAFEDPNDPVNPLIYIVFLLVFTGAILFIIKIKKERSIKYLFMIAFGLILFTVFSVVFTVIFTELYYMGLEHASPPVFDAAVFILLWWLPISLPVFLLYAMDRNPEWYVVDTVGLITAAGATAIFGISLSILPLMILLIALAVYDAISVYKTKHMVTLADSVVNFRLPVLLVVPKKAKYSLKKQRPLKEQIASGQERAAMFMGLGDIVIPGALVVSSFTFLPTQYTWGVLSSLLVSMGALVGALCGYSALMYYVNKGNPQAGLPLLNSGVIAGYVVSYLAVYRDLGLGIVWGW